MLSSYINRLITSLLIRNKKDPFSLDFLYKKVSNMNKEKLTTLLYLQTKSMEYRDKRANEIKFLKINGDYYINYELIFLNIVQILAPSHIEFAAKHFRYNPNTGAVIFNEEVVEKYFSVLYLHHNIKGSTPKRVYKSLSIKNFFFKVNLLQIPKEIALSIEQDGVEFKHAIKEDSNSYKNKNTFMMSYKYIILK